MLLKALENCTRQPSQIAIVTEAVHAAACLLRMSTADDAATGSRAEKTAELAKILIVESGADKQVRALNFALIRLQVLGFQVEPNSFVFSIAVAFNHSN